MHHHQEVALRRVARQSLDCPTEQNHSDGEHGNEPMQCLGDTVVRWRSAECSGSCRRIRHRRCVNYSDSTEPRNSRAAVTPPALCGMPARCKPISTPDKVPHSIKSLKWPRWPIRKILPRSRPRPVPSDMSNASRMISRSRSASNPSGTKTAVREFECSRASSHTVSSPQAGMAVENLSEAFFLDKHLQGLAEAVKEVGCRRVGKEPGAAGFEHRLPVPV